MDIELQKLAKAAQSAFNTYKARLRREGHQVKNDMDYRNVSGISGTAIVLRDEWLEAENALERQAGVPPQVELPGMSRETVNPLGLHLNHRYRLLSGHESIPEGTEFLFRGYNAADDLFSFYSDTHGGLRGPTTWVKESFDLVNAPDFDPTIPVEDAALSESMEYEEDGKYLVKRVSPERFAQLAAADSSKSLARKNPTAKSVEIMSDVSYVVTAVFHAETPAEAKLWLTPCVPVDKDFKGEGAFKCGKDRWRLLEPDARIVIRIASVEAVVNTPDPGAANQADPLEWLKNFAAKGFLQGTDTVELAPRSFQALATQVGMVEEGRTEFYCSELELHVRQADMGLEIEGWEELVPAPALEVVEGGPDAGEAVESAESAVASADSVPDGAALDGQATSATVKTPSLGEATVAAYSEVVDAVDKWDMTFTEALNGSEVQVGIKWSYDAEKDLFTLVWLDGLREPVAALVDSQAVKDSKLSMVDAALQLVQAVS